MYAFWLVLTNDLLEDRRVTDVAIIQFVLILYVKQIDSMLRCIFSVINISDTLGSDITSYATFLLLPHFDVICDITEQTHGIMESIS